MRRIILSVACMVLAHSSTLLNKRHNDFRKKKNLLNTKRVFLSSVQISSETFLNLRRIQRSIVINVHTVSCQTPVTLVSS